MVNIKSFLKKYRWLIASGISVFVFFFWFFPEIYIYSYFKHLTNKESLESIQTIRTLILQISAGILALVGINLTWRRTRALDTQNQTNIDHLEELRKRNEQDKKSNDDNLILQQFSKASELLADETNITTRLSGIYLFEKIMNTSEEYHWQIIELLVAFVREKRSNEKYDLDNCNEIDHNNIEIDDTLKTKFYNVGIDKVEDMNPIPKKYYRVPIEKDIQAILTVLGNRDRSFEKDVLTGRNLKDLCDELKIPIAEKNDDKVNEISDIIKRIKKIDLSNVNLYKAKLNFLHLENTNCYKTHFVNSEIIETHFDNSNCIASHFDWSNCMNSHFKKVDFERASFIIASFDSCHFEYANCHQTHFECASLWDVDFENSSCYNAYFAESRCFNVDFSNAECSVIDFERAIFNIANFTNSDCSEAFFSKSQCINCNFQDADLNQAEFEFTSDITAVQLSKAETLEGVIGLSNEMKEKIIELNPKFKEELFPDEIPNNKNNEEI